MPSIRWTWNPKSNSGREPGRKAMACKLRVVILYGGRSGEHEVSLRSAASVWRHLDRNRFDPIPVAIDKQGRWLLHDGAMIPADAPSLPIDLSAPQVVLPPTPAMPRLMPLEGSGRSVEIDAVFPVMHGPLCEDGALQGLLELADIPYVGCGVLASAVGMDKDIAKRLARDAGIPVVPWVTVRSAEYARDPSAIARDVAEAIGYPNFVKPANMGSSVGVTKVKSPAELPAALAEAFRYDTKVLVEQAIDAREIEVAVLQSPVETEPPMTTPPGEIRPSHEFYSYEAKYLDDNGAALFIPARITESQAADARRIAAAAFTALEGEGLSRVDLFLDRRDSAVYFNEVNTLPGFTSISMYPKLFAAAGIDYPDLMSRLIDLAILRHARRKSLAREFVGAPDET